MSDCNCTFSKKLTGDGCEVCNPTKAIEYYKITVNDLEERMKQLEALVDGAYEVVELFKPENPGQAAWREAWLELAAKLVPQRF